ncbi:MAG: hypothetical protein U1A78_07585 [Polyangia bacterium]
MKKQNVPMTLLASAGALSGLLSLSACNDYLTGQDGEPAGPLRVVRLTLLDPGIAHGDVVFTDTSVPPDCKDPKYQSARACTNDPFGDKYGVLKSPPNPDSARRLRVVFNKVPLTLNGMELEPVPAMGLPTSLKLSDPTVLTLTCTGCSTDGGKMGVPVTYNSLQLTGSSLSPEPSQYPYGPGLQMETLVACGGTAATKCSTIGLTAATVDPMSALEPGATYTVVINPGLGGRNPEDKVLLDSDAKSLLSFKTEDFTLLAYGDGDHESAPDSSDVVTLPAIKVKNAMMMDEVVHGALGLRFNAPVDESRFTAQTVTATLKVNGMDKGTVPVRASTAVGVPLTDDMDERDGSDCGFGDRRHIYIGPNNATGSWGDFAATDTVEVTVTIKGSEIFDVSQVSTPDPMAKLPPTHPAGKGLHSLGKDLTIKVKLDPSVKAEDISSALVLTKDAPGVKLGGSEHAGTSNSFVDEPTSVSCAPVNRLK